MAGVTGERKSRDGPERRATINNGRNFYACNRSWSGVSGGSPCGPGRPLHLHENQRIIGNMILEALIVLILLVGIPVFVGHCIGFGETYDI
jgi:hypothetical protein